MIHVRPGMTEMSTGKALMPTVKEKPIPITSGVHVPVMAGGHKPTGGALKKSDPDTVAISMPTSTEMAIESPARTDGASPNIKATESPMETPALVIMPKEMEP